MSKSPIITFYGATWCPDCQRSKAFLGKHMVDYDWIDIDKVPGASEKVSDLNNGFKTIPTLIFPDGSIMAEPSNEDLAKKLGIDVTKQDTFSDIAIIGAGPTGMAAAIYTTREELSTTIFEQKTVGGQASTTELIDNYPGFPKGVSGQDLTMGFEEQARRFGAQFELGLSVTSIKDEGRYKRLITSNGDHSAKAIIIAVGTEYQKLNIPGETELTGRGVHYCATCDGPFYKGKSVLVIGGGNTALQESIYLSKSAEKVTMLVRGEGFTGSEALIEKIKATPKIEIAFGVSTLSISKQDENISVETVDANKQSKTYSADGIFVFVGLRPNTAWLKGIVELDDRGFIVTDTMFQTSIPGVFAAGDVRSGATLQIASAVGEGVAAALMARGKLREEG